MHVYSDEESAINHVNSFRNELAENLKKYQYNLEDFKSSRKKINIQKIYCPISRYFRSKEDTDRNMNERKEQILKKGKNLNVNLKREWMSCLTRIRKTCRQLQ